MNILKELYEKIEFYVHLPLIYEYKTLKVVNMALFPLFDDLFNDIDITMALTLWFSILLDLAYNKTGGKKVKLYWHWT